MSDNSMIMNVKINKRINNSSATITINFLTSLAPDEFHAGMPFEFIVADGNYPDELIIFTGVLEEVKRDDDTKRIYSIVVRNEGRLLTRQPFKHDCSTTNRSYTYNEIIDLILEDTKLEKGRGLIAIEGKAE